MCMNITITITPSTPPAPMSSPLPRQSGSRTMLASHNVTLRELLLSSGLGPRGRWFDPLTESIVVAAFCFALLLGLAGNGLVLALLCGRHGLSCPRHCYLLNLVLADILTCLLCVPVTLVRLTLKDWQLGELLCRAAPFLQQTYIMVSVLTILAIAVERYRSIVCSARLRRTQSRRWARAVIPAIWVMAVVLATPLAVNHRLERVPDVVEEGREGEAEGEGETLTLCVEHWVSDQWLALYTLILLVFQYLLPAAAIMTLHLLICRFLRQRVHLHAHQHHARGSARNRGKIARHRKNLILLTVICVTFDIEWLPITVVNILADVNPAIFPSARHFCLAYALCLLFALSSVFSNPLVYGWYNSSVRKHLFGSVHGREIELPDIRHGSVSRRSSGTLPRVVAMVRRFSANARLPEKSGLEGNEGEGGPHEGMHAKTTGHHSRRRWMMRRRSVETFTTGHWLSVGQPTVRRHNRRRSLQFELQ